MVTADPVVDPRTADQQNKVPKESQGFEKEELKKENSKLIGCWEGKTAFSKKDASRLNNGKETEDVNGSCSCHNSLAARECCFRLCSTAHKFGTALTSSLVLRRRRISDFDYRVSMSNLLKPTGDTRQVLVTRNWYESFVSGYLYHKMGRECWLDQSGKPWKKNPHGLWDTELSYVGHPYPPPNGRSICRYIAEESEEDGMRVYMDWCLTSFYSEIEHYWREGQKKCTDDRKPQVMHVCYEQLMNSSTAAATFDEIADFLYPGGQNYSYRAPEKLKGHETSTDVELRERLRDLAKQLDKDVFDGIVARRQALFGCG